MSQELSLPLLAARPVGNFGTIWLGDDAYQTTYRINHQARLHIARNNMYPFSGVTNNLLHSRGSQCSAPYGSDSASPPPAALRSEISPELLCGTLTSIKATRMYRTPHVTS